jgi:chemotaxis protein MotA
MNSTPKRSPKAVAYPGRADGWALLGIVVALGGILSGVIMEGGSLSDVAQVTAAVIVFGGTAGAVMLTVPWYIVRSALQRAHESFFTRPDDPSEAVEALVHYALVSRRDGIVALDEHLPDIKDLFLRKALMLAVDGVKPPQVRDIMGTQINVELEEAEEEAGVFECAGGYAPTIGIIGAVIGLIQVMKHLSDIAQVGSGIAVAFVATVYGVGSANLLFLPLGQKIRLRCHHTVRYHEMLLEGAIGIAEGVHPRLLRKKLEGFTRRSLQSGKRPIEVVESRVRAASA